MSEPTRVEDLPDELNFVTDSQDVEAIASHVPGAEEYDHLWVDSENGEYTEVWGGYGAVAYDYDTVHRVI